MSLRNRVREMLPRTLRGRSDRPRISVVVPAYNVESYLAECLDHILGQTFDDFEVVVVDDGSVDSTGEVAAEYAGRDGRVRVVTSTNRGLGAARNLGVRESIGELLAFVDSDDTIPSEAFEVMLRALEESGSDFVVGSVKRHRPDGEYVHPPWLRMLHRERRLGLVATDFPEILADVFAWNKLFRRDFWERQALAFPEGVRYEDQVLTTEAYLTARAFDVIRMPVYYWRVRDDGTSITQRRHEIDDLRDRIDTKRTSLQLVQDLGTPELTKVFYNFVLCMDLPSYFQEIPGCGDDYWQLLHQGVADLWSQAPSFADAAMPPHYRLLAWLVLHDRRVQARTVAAVTEEHRPQIPLRLRAGRVVADLPYLDEVAADIPQDLFVLREHEVPWRVELREVKAAGSTLTLTGSVSLARVQEQGRYDVSVALSAEGGRQVPMAVDVSDQPDGGFTAQLDLVQVTAAQSDGDGSPLDWTVHICSRFEGVQRTGGFNKKVTSVLDPITGPDGVEIYLWFTPAEGLHLSRRKHSRQAAKAVTMEAGGANRRGP